MSKTVLILGAGLMQEPAFIFAKKKGWRIAAADGNPHAYAVNRADVFEPIDLKDKDALVTFAKDLQKNGGLDAVFTAGTDFSASVAWITEQLGLPGIPYQTALDASDKARMRKRFKEHGVPSPEFVVVTDSSLHQSDVPFQLPFVVKPVDNMGSRGCRLVRSQIELQPALEDALSCSRSGQAIVEQYMDGPEFSVDALVVDGTVNICGLADRHIYFSPFFIEMGHTIPTAASLEDQDRLLTVFKAGIQALGIKNGAAKGDIKLTSNGPMIGEIAARLSGGFMSGWTWPLASGIHPTDAGLSIAAGEKMPDITPQKNWTCAERAWLSIPGVLREPVDADSAASTPAVYHFLPRAKAGDTVIFPVNNVSKCGNIIAAAPSREAACAAAESAARTILLPLECPNPQTEEFLSRPIQNKDCFPPAAFNLSNPLWTALEQLPPDTISDDVLVNPFTLADFSGFIHSGLLDYQGRTVDQSLQAVWRLFDKTPEICSSDKKPVLGRGFWHALVSGGYQGALYFLEKTYSQVRQVS